MLSTRPPLRRSRPVLVSVWCRAAVPWWNRSLHSPWTRTRTELRNDVAAPWRALYAKQDHILRQLDRFEALRLHPF